MKDVNSNISVKELREHLQEYVDAVKAGRSFTVIKRSKPVFKITPIDHDEQWEEVIDFTKIKRGGIDINELLTRL